MIESPLTYSPLTFLRIKLCQAGKADAERAAFAGHTQHFDATSMDVLDDVLHQRQAQAGALRHVAVLLHAIELLENSLAVLRRQTDAGILHLKYDLLIRHAAAKRHAPAAACV